MTYKKSKKNFLCKKIWGKRISKIFIVEGTRTLFLVNQKRDQNFVCYTEEVLGLLGFHAVF